MPGVPGEAGLPGQRVGAQGALGVWGGELLLRGAIVPRKRPRGRPREDLVTIGAIA